MAVKSILDIDVNDAQFGRFKELFDQYYNQLAKSPGLWKASGKEQDAVASKFEKMASAMLAQTRVIQGQAEDDKRRLASTVQSERLWTSMARSTKDFASNILHATDSLLKWTGLLSAVGGLLGAGGLFGIDRMAAEVANQRRTSSGLGMSPGQLRAFQINFGRLVDPDQFLGWLNTMETDISKQGPAFALTGKGLSGDTGADTISMLKAVRGLAQRTPMSQLGPILGAYGLNLSPEEQRRMKSMGNSEFNQLLGGYQKDASGLNIPPGVAKGWQDFTTQMQKAGATLFNTFVIGLAPLEKPLEHLSSAFTKFVETLLKSDLLKEGINNLAHWLEEFSGKIGSPKFLDSIEKFTSDMGQLADVVHDLINSPGSAFSKYVVDPALAPLKDSPGVNWFSNLFASPTSSPQAMADFMAKQDTKWGLPANTLQAVKFQESGNLLNPANSSKGAVGIMQLMPGTANQYGVNPTDPKGSIEGAGAYLADLKAKYRGDMAMALAAYNWGPGNLDTDLQKHGKDWFSFAPPETQNYVKKVGANMANGVQVVIYNNTGGSAAVAVSQLAN